MFSIKEEQQENYKKVKKDKPLHIKLEQ